MGKKYLQLTRYRKDNYSVDDEIVYLNSRCLDFSEIADDKMDRVIIPYPQNLNNDEVIDKELVDYYDSLWTKVGGMLSQYHNILEGIDYWRYYASYDFTPFIMLFLERYCMLKQALVMYPNIWVKLYVIDDYYLSRHKFWEFNNLDFFAQTIDRQILEYLKFANIEEYVVEDDEKNCLMANRQTTLPWYKKIINNTYSVLSLNVPIYTTYFAGREFRKVKFALLGKAYWGNVEGYRNIARNTNEEIRNSLFANLELPSNNEFEKIFGYFLKYNIPSVYLEDYWYIRNMNRKNRLYCPKVFIKSSYSDYAMEYAAHLYDKGVTIVNSAHSLEESFRLIQYKTDVLSKYTLQWSTKELLAKKNSISCLSTYLNGAYSVNYALNKSILYVGAGTCHRHSFSKLSVKMRSRMDEKSIVTLPVAIYKGLKNELQSNFMYRVRDDFKFDIASYIRQECILAQIDDSFKNGTRYRERLASTRIVICEDLNSTVFFETLLYDIPVILIDGKDYKDIFCESFLALMEKLKRVDVFVNDSNKVCNIINSQYDVIYEWWEEPKRQKIVQEVKNKVWEMYNGNSIKYWRSILKKGMQTTKSLD